MNSAKVRGRHREGEQLEHRRSFLSKLIRGILFGVGVAAGAAIGFHVASNDFDFGAPWSPALSLGVAILYLVALLAGTVALSRVTDELERTRAYKAAALAGTVYLVLYPVWFLLWKGGFAVEPIHWLLFVVFWIALAGGQVYYRFR